MVATLERRAVAAASEIAAAYEIAPDEAVVIYSGSNVLVHLRPAPVVARVMTGTVALRSSTSLRYCAWPQISGAAEPAALPLLDGFARSGAFGFVSDSELDGHPPLGRTSSR